jgi:predicted transcriptional regulator
MSKRTDYAYEDFILDGKSMARTLALSFGIIAIFMIVIGAVRDSTVLVAMALVYFGVGVPLILGWQQLLPWLRRRTREHWKRPDREVYASIDRRAKYSIESDVWADIAQQVATEMLDDHGPLGARYATYTLEAFRDARTAWERTDEARLLRATARARHSSVALLPLHPRWSQAILDGTKIIEFRRRPLRPDTTHIAIYETAPTQRIVAIAHIHSVEPINTQTDDPHEVTVLAVLAGGVDALEYIKDAPNAVALNLGAVMPCSLSLERLDIARAPQSVQYLSSERATALFLDVEPTYQSTEAAA